MATERDTTFRNFTPEQGKAYAASRGREYPQKLFEAVLAYHKEHGGKTRFAIDVGCGPGNATQSLAYYFDKVVGLDGSVGMIDAARHVLPEDLKNLVSFKVCPAERIADDADLEGEEVDLITSAVAAHWFDLSAFYAAAAKALRSGGTIAFWTGAPPQVCHSSPHATEINAIFDQMLEAFRPFKMPGSHFTETLYSELPLPWNVDPPVVDFSETKFVRTIFSESNGNAMLASYPRTLDQIEQSFGSGSPIIRWREAHPDLAGTDKDLLKVHFAKMREILGSGEETLELAVSLVLLLFSKT